MRAFPNLLGVCTLALLVGGLMMGGSGGLASERPDTPVSGQDMGGLYSEIGQGVKGRVTSPTGNPIRNTLIKAKSLDVPAKPVPEIAILTDSDGYYTWPLRPGDYEITVAIDRHEAASERVAVRLREITRLDFVVSK
jgi:hypothetical protein